MSQKLETVDRRSCYVDTVQEMLPKSRRSCLEYIPTKSENTQVESEKRVRREIANCNERRRMQSINAGFENLRVLLPSVHEPEKLSKATILQLTAKFINSLLMRVNVLEHEVSFYRQTADPDNESIHADIRNEVSLAFLRKRRSDDIDLDTRSKINKSNIDEATFLDLDDGNTSGRSSECYENNFACSPSSVTLPNANIASVSPAGSTCSTAARLEHLVMAIEQIEGSTLMNACDKLEPISESYSYDSHSSSLFCKFSDSAGLKSFAYSLPVSDNKVPKPTMNILKEFMLGTSSSDISDPQIPSATPNEEIILSSSPVDYPPNSILINRPIPYKYLHRPQVVVNNSH